jgi:hypothetical protein
MTEISMTESNLSGNEITGGCLCGVIRYTATAMPTWVNHCHCRDCQQHGGGAMATWVTFESAIIKFANPLAIYQSSESAERGFCSRCGSTLTWQSRSNRDLIDVAAGTLDEPAIITPQEHLFWSRHLAWLDVTDALPRHDQWRSKP